jgi:aspartyl-tRNA(Asn)/glutamyl-tRNA(Gln) amidotransferase subunit B
VVQGGALTIRVGEGDKAYEKVVRLTRAHLEEDAGKSLHEDFHGMSGIDLNRAGTPLLEIVSEPDMTSSAEAVAYARALHALVRWIDICDGNMQEGSFRCDANVSVRRPGEPLGTRREIKNLNSFRFMQQAIEYEIQWQIEQIEDGHKIHQATVLFDPDTGETRAMRSKEDAHDYRYFPDPDLPPLVIAADWIERVGRNAGAAGRAVGASAGRLRIVAVRRRRPDRQPRNGAVLPRRAGGRRCGADDAAAQVARQLGHGRTGRTPEPRRARHRRQPGHAVAARRSGGPHRGQHHFEQHRKEGVRRDVERRTQWRRKFGRRHHRSQGLKQVTDVSAIEPIIDEVLAANPKSVEEYRAGKEKAFNALVGQVMKASKGKASPAQVNELLKKKLGG